MDKRDELRQALDGIHMPEELYSKTLAAMKEQKRRASPEGFGRFTAIAAAIVMVVIGGGLMWNYLFGDWGAGPPVTEPPDAASPSASISEKPPEPPPSEGARLDLGFILDLNWPASVEYAPEVKVFPLVSSGQVYKTHIVGPVTFVDTDFEPITLPFEPARYTPITSGGNVVAYALGYDTGRWYTDHVLMLADGTLPRDPDGNYIVLYDAYELSFLTAGNLVYTSYTPPLAERTLFGLYDMEAQRQLLPSEYDWIEAYGNILYISKGGSAWLTDMKGNELYAFPEAEPPTVGAPDRTGRDYYLDAEERFFCRIPAFEGSEYFERWNGLYILRGGDYSNDSDIMYVFDASGREIYRTQYYTYRADDHFIVAAADGFDMIDSRGNVRHFPAGLERRVAGMVFDGKEIHWENYRYDDDESVPYYSYYAVDEMGHVREATPAERPFNGWVNEPVYHDYRTSLNSIRDKNGNILLETEDYLQKCGNFIIRFRYIDEYTFRSEPSAIYNVSGKPLIDYPNLYGVIYEAPAPYGGIFVYFDQNTCALLDERGDFLFVPNTPAVEKVYYGG